MIAVPWVDDAKPYNDLLIAFAQKIGIGTYEGAPYDFKLQQKPHGRIGAIIQGGGGGDIDISIVPAREKPTPPDDGPAEEQWP